jgi:hypothetical protein
MVTYVEPRLVEEDVMILVIKLQKLARLLCALGSEAFDVELRVLRSFKMHL